jgi:hypothetical protein
MHPGCCEVVLASHGPLWARGGCATGLFGGERNASVGLPKGKPCCSRGGSRCAGPNVAESDRPVNVHRRRGPIVVAAGALIAASIVTGCGASVASTTVPTTSTAYRPPTQPTPPPARTAPPPTPSPPAAPPTPSPPAPTPSSTDSVDAVTSDGAVVVLGDGSVYSVDAGDQSTTSSWPSGDPISVADGKDHLTDLSNGDSVAVTYVGDTSDTNSYAGTGASHSLSTNSSDGSIVVLDDGSIWAVAPGDQATSSVWIDPSSITVNESSQSPPYELVNSDSEDSVTANYIGTE